jgi:hypothetical protein
LEGSILSGWGKWEYVCVKVVYRFRAFDWRKVFCQGEKMAAMFGG